MVDKMIRFLVLFLIKIKEENQFSQCGIDVIFDSIGDVVESILEYLKEGIILCLERNGLEVVNIEGLSDVFEQLNFFIQVR